MDVARHDWTSRWMILYDKNLFIAPLFKVLIDTLVVMVLEKFQIKGSNAASSHAFITPTPSDILRMIPFSRHSVPLICASLCATTITVTFSALAIPLSPVIWAIPATSIVTFIYHITTLFVGSSRADAPGPYNKYCIACAYAAPVLWISNLAVAVTFTALLYAKKLHTSDTRQRIWLPLIVAVSLLQSLLLLFMAIKFHREIKEIQYRNKWRWRIGSPTNGSQWSIAKLSS